MTLRLEIAFWSAAVLFAIGGLFVVGRQPKETDGGVARIAAISGPHGAAAPIDLQRVVDADPFRLDRTPSSIPFSLGVASASPPTSSPPVVQRPVLVLRGIAGGPPWQALVEGFPGRSGPMVVRAGDRVGELVVATIDRDTVTVRGIDTTWKLTMVRAWQ